MTFTWTTDSSLTPYKLDPYSEWLIDKGSDFDFSVDEVKEDADDFSYVGAVQTFEVPDLPTGGSGHEIARLKTKVGSTDLVTRVRISDPITSLTGTGPGSLDDFLFGEGEDFSGALDETIAFRTPLRKSANPRTPRDVFDATYPLAYTQPSGSTANKVVVVGILDDAVNIAHERFRLAGSTTRVDYAWLQDGVARTPSGPSDPTDRHVGFGRELVRSEIESAIAAADGDDGALLAALGLIDFSRAGYNSIARPASHGTHVLDIAAGADTASADVNQRIVSVQMPTMATAETSGALLGYFVLCGMLYILERTRVISKELDEAVPAVINLSYGFSGGPHDGSHFIQRAIRAAIEDHGRRMSSELGFSDAIVEIVVPSGNRNIGRGHAESRPSTAASETVELELPWRHQPGDRTASYLELWIPVGITAGSLKIGMPGQTPVTVPLLPSGNPQILAPTASPDDVIVRVTLDSFDADSHFGQTKPDPTQNKKRILIAMAPTEAPRGVRLPAPCGTWSRWRPASPPPAADQRIEAWIQRDDSPYGFRNKGRPELLRRSAICASTTGARSTRRIRARDSTGSSVVRREGTTNGLATGAHNRGGGRLRPQPRPPARAAHARATVADGEAQPRYTASAKGDVGDYTRGQRRPDAVAVSDASPVLGGLLAAGTFSGTRVALSARRWRHRRRCG
ncbi:MAG: hypothetical protein AcusKO_14520 [Acuticoccus sp.]